MRDAKSSNSIVGYTTSSAWIAASSMVSLVEIIIFIFILEALVSCFIGARPLFVCNYVKTTIRNKYTQLWNHKSTQQQPTDKVQSKLQSVIKSAS